MDISLIYSLITAIFIGGAAGYLGTLMITRKMALAGDALGHIALPGMGLALLFGFDVSLGAFAFLLLGVLAIWYLETRTNLSTEALVGIIFVLSLSIGVLITPDPELLHVLVGDISKITLAEVWVSAILSVAVLFGVKKIYKKLMLSFISEDLASANKIDVKKYNLFYLLLITVIIALGVKFIGSLLVGALVIVPAAAAKNISRNMRQYSLWSVLIGVLSGVAGILISGYTMLPAGPVIILSSIAFFIISLVVSVKQ